MKLLLTIPVESTEAPALTFLLDQLSGFTGDFHLDLADLPPRLLLTTTQAWKSANLTALSALERDPRSGGTSWRWQDAPDLDWGSSFSDALRPLQFGPLTLLPADPAAGARGPGMAVVLDAREAFGSGLHPTTALILQRLTELDPAGPLLDVGTGSGVLALAALRLGFTRAAGIDTDPRALLVAHENARRNGLEDRLELWACLPDPTQRFPLIVANILPAVLVSLASALVTRLSSGGVLLLSGFQSNDVDEVWSAYRHLGCRMPLVEHMQDWVRLEILAPW